MKIRNGFVSNSSSCSFTVPKDGLNGIQLSILQNFKQFIAMCISAGIEFDSDEDYTLSDTYKWADWWRITEEEDQFNCETNMDNFDMLELMDRLGINYTNVYHS